MSPALPPVLLLHGLATNSQRTWLETGWIDLLRETGRTVLAPDLPGHGGAAQPTDPVAYADFEEQVLAMLPDECVDAVGFSLGARTLLILAGTHPERFRRLVLAGVGENLFRRDGSTMLLAQALDAAAAGTSTASDEEHPMVRHFERLAASSGQDLRALVALLRRESAPVVDVDLLRRVTHPVLVVLGDQDFAGPAAPLVDALHDATFVELRGVDHFATPKAMGFLDAGLHFLGKPSLE